MNKLTPQQKITTLSNSLRDISAKEEIKSPLRQIEKEIREAVAELLEENAQLKKTIDALINESDEGVDNI